MKNSRLRRDRGRNQSGTPGAASKARLTLGFTLLELCMTMAVVVVMTAIAIPVVKSSLNAYKLSTAVASLTGAVQTTRYRAIQTGYPFQIVYTAATSKYQILSDPTDTGAFANVGNPIVFSRVSNILNQNTTITFRPGGAVQSPQALANGNVPMTLTYLNLIPEAITVSAYGRVNVVP